MALLVELSEAKYRKYGGGLFVTARFLVSGNATLLVGSPSGNIIVEQYILQNISIPFPSELSVESISIACSKDGVYTQKNSLCTLNTGGLDVSTYDYNNDQSFGEGNDNIELEFINTPIIINAVFSQTFRPLKYYINASMSELVFNLEFYSQRNNSGWDNLSVTSVYHGVIGTYKDYDTDSCYIDINIDVKTPQGEKPIIVSTIEESEKEIKYQPKTDMSFLQKIDNGEI